MNTSIAVSYIPNTDDGDICTFARTIGIDIYQLMSCVRTFGELLDKLHGIGLCHGDLSARHIIVSKYNQVSCLLLWDL